MKLYTSPTSPYGRLARIVVAEKDDPASCEVVFADPWDTSKPEVGVNPLHKVPILESPAGPLFDSRVISEYLDENMAGPALLPEDPARRAQVRSLAAVAAGATDMGVLMLLPKRVDPEAATDKMTEYCSRKIMATAAHLGKQVSAAGFIGSDSFSLADGSAVGLFGFMDFRFPDFDWRGASAELAGWYEEVCGRPSVSATVPKA